MFSSFRLLASKNLPAAIEDVSGDQLPESIREKSDQIRSQGGITGLEEKIYALPELLQRNKEIIDEVNLLCMVQSCKRIYTAALELRP